MVRASMQNSRAADGVNSKSRFVVGGDAAAELAVLA